MENSGQSYKHAITYSCSKACEIGAGEVGASGGQQAAECALARLSRVCSLEGLVRPRRAARDAGARTAPTPAWIARQTRGASENTFFSLYPLTLGLGMIQLRIDNDH